MEIILLILTMFILIFGGKPLFKIVKFFYLWVFFLVDNYFWGFRRNFLILFSLEVFLNQFIG